MSAMTRVMMVDDEADYLTPLSYWLQSKGYDVVTETNPLNAIEIIREQAPDVLFLDINMPELSGIQTLERIREFNRELPVIIVTAASQDQEKFDKARGLGIAGFFPKQSSLDEFGRLLELTLRTRAKKNSDNS